jgi:hypothetical protein
MTISPPQFRVRTLLVAVAVAAAMAEAYLLLRPSKSLSAPNLRGSTGIARLIHSGDWDVSPQAIPNLMDVIRKPPYEIALSVALKDLHPRDPNLVWFPLIYMHGRAAFSFTPEDLEALRYQFDPSGSILFADAACGNADFDACFRRFVAEMFPNNPLVPIPNDDPLLDGQVGADISYVKYTKGAGGRRGFPQLEGVRTNHHWSIIYSRYGVGCALDRDHDGGCKGYIRQDAARIGLNVLMYSTLP